MPITLPVILPETARTSSGALVVSKADVEGVLNTNFAFTQFGLTSLGVLPVYTAAAFTAAVTAAEPVFIPIGSEITLTTTVDVPSGAYIRIDGQMNLAAGSNCSMLRVVGNNVTICGRGVIDGNKSQNPSNPEAPIGGIVGGTNGALLDNLLVQDLTIQNVANWPCSVIAKNSKMLNLSVKASGNATEFVNGYNNHIDNCYAEDITDIGLCFYGASYNSSLTNCKATRCDIGIGLVADTGQPGPANQLLFASNMTWANRSSGMAMSDTQANDSNGLTIVGHISTGDGTNSFGDQNNGISVSGCTDVQIIGCRVSNVLGAGAKGIYILPAASNVSVSGNTVHNIGIGGGNNTGSRGIYFYAGVGGVCEGNTVSDTQTTRTMQYGIMSDTGATVTVGINYVFGAGLTAYSPASMGQPDIYAGLLSAQGASIPALTGPIGLAVYTLAGLNNLPVASDVLAYCSDGRRPGQGAGAGTGLPAYRDSAGIWTSVIDGAAVSS